LTIIQQPPNSNEIGSINPCHCY